MIDEVLSRAVVAYIGNVGHLETRAPEERVAEAVGDASLDVVPRIRLMLRDLHSAQPPLWNAEDIAAVGQNAATWLRDQHPELSDAAVKQVADTFSFDWK